MKFVFNFYVENNPTDVTANNCQELREYIAQYFSNTKVTWMYQFGVLQNSNMTGVINYIDGCLSTYEDDIGIATSFPCIDWNDAEMLAFVGDVYDRIIATHSVTPVSAAAYGWSSSQLTLLKSNFNISIVMGTAWSQVHVDRYSGDGSIPYPYFASKRHNLIPAEDANDNTGVLVLDTNIPDLVGNVHQGVRFTLHPADPSGYDGNNAKHITDQYYNNQLNDFVLLTQYIEVAWLNNTPQLKLNWKDYFDKIYASYLNDIDFYTMRDFNTWFRNNYTDTPDYKFIFTGSGYECLDHNGIYQTSDSNLKNRWLFTKEGRCCVQENLTTHEYEIIDTISYKGDITEPGSYGNHWNIINGLNWKFDQSSSFKMQNMVNKWQKEFEIYNLITKRYSRWY